MDPYSYDTADDLDTHRIIALQTLHEEVPDSSWRIFRVFHATLTALTLLGNCVLLMVSYGLVSKLTPPVQLVTNLCFANMLAAWAVVTMYFPHTSCQEEIQTGLMLTAHNASALTILAYVITYNIAVFKPLEYSTIVSCSRVWITIAMIWVTSLLLAHSHFLVTLAKQHHNTLFCYQVFYNTYIALILCVTIAAVLVLTTAIVITKAMLYLRPIMAFIDPNQSTIEPRKSTRETTTIIIITVLYLVTWIPYITVSFEHVQVHNTKHGYTTAMIMFTFMSLVLVNCVANPIVFALRLDTILAGYDKLYLKLRAWGIDNWGRLSKRLERDDTTSSPLNPIESVF